MTNRAKHFILQARVSTIDDLLGEWMLAINAEFQLNISNVTSARIKSTGTWDVIKI